MRVSQPSGTDTCLASSSSCQRSAIIGTVAMLTTTAGANQARSVPRSVVATSCSPAQRSRSPRMTAEINDSSATRMRRSVVIC